jgi:hypothetical protein
VTAWTSVAWTPVCILAVAGRGKGFDWNEVYRVLSQGMGLAVVEGRKFILMDRLCIFTKAVKNLIFLTETTMR